MIFASFYSLIILPIKTISYVSTDLYKKSETLRIILYSAYFCKFILEVIIIVMFIKSARELYIIKSRKSRFTLK